MKQNEASNDVFLHLEFLCVQYTCRVFPVCLCLACAMHCVLGAGAAAGNKMSRASALAGVTRKVIVQSK